MRGTRLCSKTGRFQRFLYKRVVEFCNRVRPKKLKNTFQQVEQYRMLADITMIRYPHCTLRWNVQLAELHPNSWIIEVIIAFVANCS